VFPVNRAGLSNAEIGRAFFISDTTVMTQITQILMKFNIRDQVQAVVRAYDEMALFDHS
jgi:DNA-binding NarL/FixJ family response regulator